MFHEPLFFCMEDIAMVETNRVYTRNTVSIPITFVPDELPPIASHTEALPMTPLGTFLRETYGAFMKNTSVDGFCFMTGKKLAPGTEVEVKMVNFIPIPMGESKLSDCLARVMWCNSIPMTDARKCYEIGAKRIRQSILPIINWDNPDFASVRCF